MILLLALDAALTHVGDYRVDAVFIDNPHALGRQAQLDPAILRVDPELVGMQVRQKATTRPVIRMRHIVSANRFFTGYLTDPRHGGTPLNSEISLRARTLPEAYSGFKPLQPGILLFFSDLAFPFETTNG
jgi:hypothetical protein